MPAASTWSGYRSCGTRGGHRPQRPDRVGHDNVGPDVQDLYIERLRTQDGTLQAEFEGQWEDVTIRREEIKIKGRDPGDARGQADPPWTAH